MLFRSNDTATTEIYTGSYTLTLHDALPVSRPAPVAPAVAAGRPLVGISSYDILTPDDAPDPVLTVVQGRPGVISARLRRGTADRTAAGPVANVLVTLLDDFGSGELALAGNTEDVTFAIAERGIVVRTLPPRAESPARAVVRLALTADPAASIHALAPDYGELPAVVLRGQAL